MKRERRYIATGSGPLIYELDRRGTKHLERQRGAAILFRRGKRCWGNPSQDLMCPRARAPHRRPRLLKSAWANAYCLVTTAGRVAPILRFQPSRPLSSRSNARCGGFAGVRASLQAHSLIDYEPIGFRNDRPVYWGTCLVVGMMGLTAY